MRTLKRAFIFINLIIFSINVFAKAYEEFDVYELAKSGTESKLNKGIRKNRNSVNEQFGENGDSLLMVALENSRDRKIVTLLLDWGVDPDFENYNGDTALIYAAKHEANYKILKEIITHNASHSKKFARVAHENSSGQKAIDFVPAKTKEEKILLKYTKRQDKKARKNKEQSAQTDPTMEPIEIEEPAVIAGLIVPPEALKEEPPTPEPEPIPEPIAEIEPEHEPLPIETIEDLALEEPTMPEITEEMLASQAAAQEALKKRRDPNKRIYLFYGLETFDTYDDTANAFSTIAEPDAKGKNGRTLLHKAASEDDITMIDRLLKSGASINMADNDDWTALMYAARFSKKKETIKALLDAGADINAKNKIGANALRIAVSYTKTPAIIDELARKSQKSSVAASFIAAISAERETKILKTFLAQDISANMVYRGKTPLMYAAERNTNTSTIKFLLDNGADKTFLNADRKDAFYFASNNPNLPHNNVYWSLNNSVDN